MIRKPEVLRDYSRMNPLSQVQFDNNVAAALQANPSVFIPADLPFPTAELTEACTTLSTKYNDYKVGGSSKKEAYLLAQAVWLVKFNLTADFMELIAASSGQQAGTIIQLAAFHITKTESEPAALPGSPVVYDHSSL